MDPEAIPNEVLNRASDYDRTHRVRDGAGWRRVERDQIRRILVGLAEQGYIISAKPKIVINVEPRPNASPNPGVVDVDPAPLAAYQQARRDGQS